ncbi:MAG TPA: HAMP domain-containing sensor histidine kinase [Gemmatimonadales bacterium]|nr:HAMP domain-containing sensor histidine kinase [Gemmatimonadales bacterium]
MPLWSLRRLAFRNRILLALLILAVPSAILSAGWVVTLLQTNPARSSRVALEPIRATGQTLIETLDSTKLAPLEARAVEEHVKAINKSLILSQSGFYYSRYKTIALAIVISVLGGFLLYAAYLLARSLSRQLSRPADELVGWMERIRRHEPLPEEGQRGSGAVGQKGGGGAPEFEMLRSALRETAASLQQARTAELESERLRAFREVARRVAHEMKNPLTPIRFAIGQIERAAEGQRGSGAEGEQEEALEVLRVETARLEQLAREFANLGRLPEGPAAEVDLGELLGELVRTSVPTTMHAALTVDPAAPRIVGHYDPLHRAFSNLIRNAVEATGEPGRLEVTVSAAVRQSGSEEASAVRVTVADHGAGVPPERRGQIFEPYVTGKAGGTGLGLAIAKQAIDLHRGTIEVSETDGGGATFTVRLPAGAESRVPALSREALVERRIAERRRRTL